MKAKNRANEGYRELVAYQKKVDDLIDLLENPTQISLGELQVKYDELKAQYDEFKLENVGLAKENEVLNRLLERISIIKEC